ncbi:hypothetical protein K461DRAFT_297540 [Myriangium duriaei CBS 260.36]|uniref:Uncharacterized protein n=1 Tax=Myriangium duriaei CBS 260.36 TaxID=1168546 RepID=A0A9P4ISW6_9PEZI|nr:hypothetical protein K461DRAFT_297540 [Myriangium duriaei CBS 260.36]
MTAPERKRTKRPPAKAWPSEAPEGKFAEARAPRTMMTRSMTAQLRNQSLPSSQVMRIPELVRMILKALCDDSSFRGSKSRSALSHASQVNRLFFDLGMPFLWHFPTISTLNSCPARRRRLVYAPLVRTLLLHSQVPFWPPHTNYRVSPPELRMIGKECTELRKIVWEGRILDKITLDDFVMFLSDRPSIREIEFVAIQGSKDGLSLFGHLARLRSLTRLKYHFCAEKDEIQQVLQSIDQPFLHLQSLDLVFWRWPGHDEAVLRAEVEMIRALLSHIPRLDLDGYDQSSGMPLLAGHAIAYSWVAS